MLATIGMTVLWLVYAWLASGAISGHLARRKGYNAALAVATGLVAPLLAPACWLLVGPRRERDGASRVSRAWRWLRET